MQSAVQQREVPAGTSPAHAYRRREQTHTGDRQVPDMQRGIPIGIPV